MHRSAFLILAAILSSCSTSPKCKCEQGAYIPESKTCETRYYFAPVCAQVYEPVCGCNGITYGNACEAHQNGVVWFAEGRCLDQTKKK